MRWALHVMNAAAQLIMGGPWDDRLWTVLATAIIDADQMPGTHGREKLAAALRIARREITAINERVKLQHEIAGPNHAATAHELSPVAQLEYGRFHSHDDDPADPMPGKKGKRPAPAVSVDDCCPPLEINDDELLVLLDAIVIDANDRVRAGVPA